MARLGGGLAAALAMAVVGLSWRFSGEIVAFDTRSPAEVLAEDGLSGPADVGLPAPEAVEVRAAGATLSGWLFRHPRPAGCGVVFSHGHRGTRHGSLKFTPTFWRRGCHLLLLDARHHGASQGDTFTWGAREAGDLSAAVDALAGWTGVPPARLGLFGDSMGAAISLLAAARRSDLAFVVADSPFADLPSIVTRRGVAAYGGWVRPLVAPALALAGWRAGFDPWSVSPEAAARQVRRPALVIHSRADAFTPVEHGLRVHAALPGPARRLLLTDRAEHARSVVADPAGYARALEGFLADLVPGFGRPAVEGPAEEALRAGPLTAPARAPAASPGR